ncbi:putative methylesterase 11, chloroplastic [Phalaenopsis equestris]|uniref:putative methylesterase 11, chloroplastic n=1 Tax=Phalaenopsis equestris TaxID=78828 RepID=UPI0009E5AEC4|nr:putative methylesterase 11, chloroplastic [Phalaenopsis equestris]
MGGILSCFHEPESPKRPAVRRKKPGAQQDAIFTATVGSSRRWEKGRAMRSAEESLIQEAAALLLLQQQQNGGGEAAIGFDRSTSLRYPGLGTKKQQGGLPRSSSSRPRSIADPVVAPQQLVNQKAKIEDLETSHFVLVHGGGFGAWCWYKTIALLQDAGFKVNAIDLTGSGIHSFDPNKITSLSQYVKPLTSFLENLGDTDKVILVGHDFGGACISYAMEALPTKIAKAVFLAAAMLKDGQNTLDMFSHQQGNSDLLRQAQIFLYANGKNQPPTAIELDKSFLKDLLFNQSPDKDVALASVSLRPIPFAPVLQKLELTGTNYGSVRRFYIETAEDNAISLPLQQIMCESDPPEKIFRLKGSDHSPFFSKPQALHKLLVEIANIPNALTQQTNNDE